MKITHQDVIPQKCPLTRAQLGVYLECVRNPASKKYNIPVICRLPKGTNQKRFVAAVKQVLPHHPAFYVTVGAPDGVPSMIYRPRELAVSQIQTENMDTYAAAFSHSFDLENGPLCRFEYVSSPDGDAFLFDAHHLIFDGTSLNVFVRQIAAVYDGGECADETLTVFDVSAAEA